MVKKNILCIASYEKGHEFLRQAHAIGWNVFLLTSKSLDDAPWPKDAISEIYYMNDVNKEWNLDEMIKGVSYLNRSIYFDRIVALDDFDVEKAAALREHLRVPGMGDTTARYFRDKLAMRMKSKDAGIDIPDFIGILNHEKVTQFLDRNQPPYVLKPRLQAGATGIKKIQSSDELWSTVNELGDRQSYFLLEKYIPGEIYHVDSILIDKKVVFSLVSKYGLPPMEVAHEGRVFSTMTLLQGSDDESSLKALNSTVLPSLGLVQGVSHTEYIKGQDGKFYFLETSARVGGAHIVDLVEAATGLNLWQEWAKIETLDDPKQYRPLPSRNEYAGLIVSLAKQEYPDLSSYNDPEVHWKLNKQFHAGIIVRSPHHDRVSELMQQYVNRFYHDFFTSAPPKDKPSF